jgi:hypothetical protein
VPAACEVGVPGAKSACPGAKITGSAQKVARSGRTCAKPMITLGVCWRMRTGHP